MINGASAIGALCRHWTFRHQTQSQDAAWRISAIEASVAEGAPMAVRPSLIVKLAVVAANSGAALESTGAVEGAVFRKAAYGRPCSRSKRLAANGGTRLVTRLAPVSLDGGVRPGRRVGLVRHFIQCVFNSLPTMLKPLSLVVSRYEHWLAND
jgi:hypothetical protein